VSVLDTFPVDCSFGQQNAGYGDLSGGYFEKRISCDGDFGPVDLEGGGGGGNNQGGGGLGGAPGPVLGAGLPVLAVGAGIYWVVRRRKKAASKA
jgi:hypothetical protein